MTCVWDGSSVDLMILYWRNHTIKKKKEVRAEKLVVILSKNLKSSRGEQNKNNKKYKKQSK